MSKSRNISILIGFAFSVLAFLITWILTARSSPLYTYFLFNVAFPNVWRVMNILPFLLATIASGRFHGFSPLVFWLGLGLQWFVLGWILSLPIRDRFGKQLSQPLDSYNSPNLK